MMKSLLTLYALVSVFCCGQPEPPTDSPTPPPTPAPTAFPTEAPTENDTGTGTGIGGTGLPSDEEKDMDVIAISFSWAINAFNPQPMPDFLRIMASSAQVTWLTFRAIAEGDTTGFVNVSINDTSRDAMDDIIPIDLVSAAAGEWNDSSGPHFEMTNDILRTASDCIDNVRCLQLSILRHRAAVAAGDEEAIDRHLCNGIRCLQRVMKLRVRGINGLNAFADVVRDLGIDNPFIRITPEDLTLFLETLIADGRLPEDEQWVIDALEPACIATEEDLMEVLRRILDAGISEADIVQSAMRAGVGCDTLADWLGTFSFFKLIPGSFPHTSNSWGDPHYTTFDGLTFKYDGPCSYLLASNDCGASNQSEPLWSVIVNHGRCRSKEKHVVCLKETSLEIGDATKVTVREDNTVLINDKVRNDSRFFEFDDLLFSKEKYFLKSQTFERVRIHTEFGLEVVISQEGSGTVWITAPDDATTCGMLGNNNGDANDDLITKNGMRLPFNDENIIRACDSWMVATDKQPMQCDLFPMNSYASTLKCTFNKETVQHICNDLLSAQMKVMTGKDIQACFSQSDTTGIDETRIYDDCITEMCNCHSSDISKCFPMLSFDEFKNVCQQQGVTYPK